MYPLIIISGRFYQTRSREFFLPKLKILLCVDNSLLCFMHFIIYILFIYERFDLNLTFLPDNFIDHPDTNFI